MEDLRRTRSIRRIAVAVMATALAAALLLTMLGCGGSGGSTSTASKTTATSGAPIKVSVLSIVNSPAFSLPGVFGGAQAAANAINAAGGVGRDHHPIKVITCDYELNANKATLCARDAVGAGVVADVGSANPFTPGTTPIFHAADISQMGNPYGDAQGVLAQQTYPIVGGGNALIYGSIAYLASLGVKKIAWVEPVPAPPQNAQIVDNALKATGLTMVKHVRLPNAGVSDYAPYAKQVKDAVDQGAEAVITNVSTPLFQLVATFNQLGGQTRWYELGQIDSARLKAAGSAANGLYNVSFLPPETATQIPAVKDWLGEMAAARSAGVSGADQINAEGFDAWLSMYALKQLLADTSGPVTAQTVTALVTRARNIDVRGLLSWSPAEKPPAQYGGMNSGTDDVWLSKIVDGKAVAESEKPFKIIESVQSH